MASFVLPPLFMLLLSWQWQWHLAYGFGCSTIASSSKVSSPSSCSWHHCDHRYLTPFIAPTCRLNRRKVQLLRSTALFSTVAAPPPPHINDSVTSTAAATPSPSPPPLTFRVGIIGSGSIAYGTASLIASLGHDPMVWSPSGTSAPKPNEMPPTTTVEDSAKTLTAASETFAEMQCTGVIEHNFNVRIAHSPNELVRCNDGVLIVALPANGHKSVMDTLSPVIVDHLLARYAEASTKGQQNQQYDHHSVKRASITTPPMHIIISSHASLGAVYFMQSLRDECHKRRQKKMNGDDDDGFSSLLNNHDILEGVRITSWGTTAITARKTSDNTVRVTTVRQLVDYCTVPTFSTLSSFISSSADDPTRTTSSNASRRHELLICNDGYELCTTLFGPRFRNRKGGLLAISLSNLNPQAHLGIVLGNMSRMDPPPPPPPLPNSFTSLHVQPATSPDTSTSSTPPSFPSWYQGQNITPNIGRLMEALDTERIAIAKALGIEVRTIHEHFSWSFHVPMETLDEDASSANESSIPPKMRPLTVSEMNQQMHHYLKNDVLGPSSPNSRYVLEDVPYGLVLTILLGKLVNKPAVLHESGIRILSAMYGRDFMEENDLLRGLGLLKAGNSDDDEFMRMIPSLDHWKEMANTGMFHARD